jgi:hypothetical protein
VPLMLATSVVAPCGPVARYDEYSEDFQNVWYFFDAGTVTSVDLSLCNSAGFDSVMSTPEDLVVIC